MEKKLNKMEEINEEVKVEELTEETLDTVDGGSVTVAGVVTAVGTIWGCYEAVKGAWNLGQWIGKQIVGH
ncbi:MAG: hypothetical protein IJV76_13795 [Clostridia bacterium]|nr:hypothetical protein [Clostridia bacterium]